MNFNRISVGNKELKTVNPAVHRASTVLFDSYDDMDLASSGKYAGIYYGTNRLPTQRELEESLSLLEKSSITRLFPSGISAIRHVLLSFLKSGDHIVVCDNVYGPTKMMCKYFLPKFNIETTFTPPDLGASIKKYIKKNTKMIFMESPGSITFEIQNIEEIVKAAKQNKIITAIDNTWATPLYFKPLENGIDISIQSVTKYISGNSDLLLGSVSLGRKTAENFDSYYSLMGIYCSENDCYSALKGLKTLELRLRQHEKNAMELASWLENHDIIERVLHPGLKSHPQHELWKTTFTGSSGLFGFIFKPEITKEQTAQFIDSLELFGKGFSWGGYKSLISCGIVKRDSESEFNGKNIIRVSAGLEDLQDLKNDISRALKIIIK